MIFGGQSLVAAAAKAHASYGALPLVYRQEAGFTTDNWQAHRGAYLKFGIRCVPKAAARPMPIE